jgi:DNA-binding NarL/FixJ family response regulator
MRNMDQTQVLGENRSKTVAICDTQPVTAEGVRALLEPADNFRFLWGVDSLSLGIERCRYQRPDLLVVDKGFGLQDVMRALDTIRQFPDSPSLVVWGVSVTEAEAVRLFQAGARGVMRKGVNVASLLACLGSVASGSTWLEGTVFRDFSDRTYGSRSDLTPREQQVMELVEQGMKNREIARELGIRPGTVKIHLKHIFEKTGVRGRYGLALSGMRQRLSSPELAGPLA